MKKVIELLKSARGGLEEAQEFLSRETIKDMLIVVNGIIDEALAELKARPRRESVDRDRRVKCNWCESVFYEDYIRVDEDEEQCPVCGEKGYLMDIPEREEKPRWETPEQWEKRTGEPWPDSWAVYVRQADGSSPWIVKQYLDVKITKWLVPITIICATEAGTPSDDWRPEEENQ
jgi:hypothetical protein